MNWIAPPIWEQGECWIIGGGSSMPREFGVPEDLIAEVVNKHKPRSVYSDYLAPLHDRHVIGINNAYQIGNWIDCVFFGDCAWYLVHRQALARFRNLKVTCCNRFAGKPREKAEGIKYLAKDDTKRQGISNRPSRVSWNANSGAAAISLAAHFGTKRIILLGFDMCLAENGQSHWDGGHGNKKPPPFERHLRGFPVIAGDAKKRGIEILNASPISAIEVFPKVQIKDVL